MKRKFYISTIVLFISVATEAKGPGDDLKLPRKDTETNRDPDDTKGVKGFVTLLPDGKGSSQSSMRDKGLAIHTGNAAVELEMKNYTAQFLAKRGNEFKRMKTSPQHQRIFAMYDRILTQYGIPKELKYLSVVESALNPNCLSHAGALGPWQLMPDEAQRYNLIRGGRDLRTDFEASTHAASKLIKSLYKQYDDWLLVLAAYNCGPGRVNRAIKQSGSRDFWKLQKFLPNETRHHVRRILAVQHFFESTQSLSDLSVNCNKMIAKASQIPTNELQPGMGILRIKGIYNAATVAKFLEIEENTFNYNNPGFNSKLGSGQAYDMRIPSEKIQTFIDNRETILQQGLDELLK